MVVRRRKLRVEEYPHAYLIKGTHSIDAARKALWSHLGKKKWTRIRRMPARPFWDGEESCVGLYFAAGPGGKQVFKP